MRALATVLVVLLLNLAACVAAPPAQSAGDAKWPTPPEDAMPEPGEVSPRRVH